MIIHMVTAADGAVEQYQNLNNEARSEGINAALALDEKIYKIYCYHYYYYRVSNNSRNMQDKINLAMGIIFKNFFGVRNPAVNHKIFLLRNPSGSVFDYLLKGILGPKVDILDTYLKVFEENTSYVRRFNINGSHSFIKGRRSYYEGESSTSKKSSIQWREYEDLIEMYKE